jgi:hypothetical protein
MSIERHLLYSSMANRFLCSLATSQEMAVYEKKVVECSLCVADYWSLPMRRVSRMSVTALEWMNEWSESVGGASGVFSLSYRRWANVCRVACLVDRSVVYPDVVSQIGRIATVAAM